MGIKGDKAVWEAEEEGIKLFDVTIGDLLDQKAEMLPGKEALIYNYPELGINTRLNYAQYRDEVNKVAKGLLALGIEKGEHVAIWAPNLPPWIMLELAAAKIGAVLITINTAYRAAEAEYVLRQGDVTTLFLVEEVRGNSYLDSLYSIAPELKSLGDPAHETLHSEKLPRLKRAILIGQTERPGLLLYSQVVEMGQTVSDEELQERQTSVKPDDVAIVMYTSGTTGFPKGAMLSHSSMLNDLYLGARGKSYAEARVVNPMPLFHVAGCVGGVLASLLHGATLIQMIAFDPVKQMELISIEKGTRTFSVPTMIIAMLNHPRFLAGEFDLSSLETIGTGAAAVPVFLIEQVKEKMGAECTIVFGQTESSGALTGTLETDTFELRSATVGKAYPHTDIKIVNPATGEPVSFGERGELLARGPLIMKGYYNMPEKTAEAIDNEGWLHTGDLATMSAEGYINIVGRVKEMIIRGGENIFPVEIEGFLLRHPKIADAAIVGIPDAYMGEEAVAMLRLKPGESATEDEIREYCRANISHNKVPKYIRFVEEFPMTTSGKVKKFEIKAAMIKELGLEEVAQIKTA